jgi:hypothetical protein
MIIPKKAVLIDGSDGHSHKLCWINRTDGLLVLLDNKEDLILIYHTKLRLRIALFSAHEEFQIQTGSHKEGLTLVALPHHSLGEVVNSRLCSCTPHRFVYQAEKMVCFVELITIVC